MCKCWKCREKSDFLPRKSTFLRSHLFFLRWRISWAGGQLFHHFLPPSGPFCVILGGRCAPKLGSLWVFRAVANGRFPPESIKATSEHTLMTSWRQKTRSDHSNWTAKCDRMQDKTACSSNSAHDLIFGLYQEVPSRLRHILSAQYLWFYPRYSLYLYTQKAFATDLATAQCISCSLLHPWDCVIRRKIQDTGLVVLNK